MRAECALRDHPALGRWLTQQPNGQSSTAGLLRPGGHVVGQLRQYGRDPVPRRWCGGGGALSGWGYIVTGLASTSLHAVAASGSPPGEVIWAMTLSIARGLRYMHARDLVHCDVKPANILRYHNRWVLGDLGLAQRAGTAQPEGTIGYTAPERFDGIVSPKSDVYALGVTLHVAMSSERLREESTLETPTIEHI